MNRPIKDVAFYEKAKNPLIKGVNIVCDAVASTYGYNGRTVLIESEGGFPNPTKDGVSVAKSIFLDDPIESLGAEYVKQAAQKSVDESGDGPQPLYAKVLTPKGFVEMGSLSVGDIICGTNSTHQTVQGIFPKGEKEIIKVTFADGKTAECCEDHLWSITDYRGAKKVITTKTIYDKGVFKLHSKDRKMFNFYVEQSIVEFDKKELVLDPYLLGVLLGDGSLSGSGSIEISIGYNKKHILDNLILPKGITFNVQDVTYRNSYRVKFIGKDENGKYLKDILNDLGLLGVKSSTKFIPKNYIYNSLEVRKKLLQGLLDTDGYVNNRKLFEFSTISENMHNDFLELCRSLGMTMTSRILIRKENSSYSKTPIYRIQQLKGYKYGNKIIGVEKTGKTTPMQCIKVSNSDSLYITDNYIVTHNTTLTSILTQVFVNATQDYLSKGFTANEIKKNLEENKKNVIDLVKKNSRNVTLKDYINVATISANNDEVLGKIIADAFKSAGKNGIVTFERSGGKETYYEHIDGMPIERGLHHPSYANQPDGSVVFEKPLILITDKVIKSIREITHILEHVYQNKQNLLIIGDVTDEVNNSLLANKIKNNLSIAVIQPPSIISKRTEYLKDIALVTGGMMLDTFSGDLTEAYGLELLGTCEKFIIGKNDSVLIKNKDFKKVEITEKIKELSKLLKDSQYKQEKSFLQDRIAKLSCGVSIIKVGAFTDAELLEKLDRVEDAIHAVRSAILGGISAGGGIGLLNASKNFEITSDLDNIMLTALKTPAYKLNSELKTDLPLNYGTNLATDTDGDMFEMGIIDPTMVIISALENSISVATTILMTDVCVTFKRA